ncbi:hypothetical protein BH11BAC6_BH11BAC6_14990 [soil metagenome]
MCNCGNNRASLNEQPMAKTSQTKTQSPAETETTNYVFEYTGKTALTAIGTATGMRYRFNQPGDMQSVDPTDASGMMMIPVLRKRKG